MATAPEHLPDDAEIERRTKALEASRALAQEAAQNPEIQKILRRERKPLPPTSPQEFLSKYLSESHG